MPHRKQPRGERQEQPQGEDGPPKRQYRGAADQLKGVPGGGAQERESLEKDNDGDYCDTKWLAFGTVKAGRSCCGGCRGLFSVRFRSG